MNHLFSVFAIAGWSVLVFGASYLAVRWFTNRNVPPGEEDKESTFDDLFR